MRLLLIDLPYFPNLNYDRSGLVGNTDSLSSTSDQWEPSEITLERINFLICGGNIPWSGEAVKKIFIKYYPLCFIGSGERNED